MAAFPSSPQTSPGTPRLVPAQAPPPRNKGPIYFMETTGHPTVCRPGVPLTMQGIRTLRVAPGGAFNLASWTGSGATPYTLSIEAGKVSSSTGAVY